jgi:hypothetical protein
MTTTALSKQEDSGKKLKGGKKRLTRNVVTSDVDDEPMKPTSTNSGDEDDLKRGTGKKKRQMIDESDDEDHGQPDVENRNIPNAPAMVNPEKKKKGMRRVVKTRTYFDEKGYMVNEDYSSYEEGEPTT